MKTGFSKKKSVGTADLCFKHRIMQVLDLVDYIICITVMHEFFFFGNGAIIRSARFSLNWPTGPIQSVSWDVRLLSIVPLFAGF